MGIESTEAWLEHMAQSAYDGALPWERFFINYDRWRDGKPLLRVTPRGRRAKA